MKNFVTDLLGLKEQRIVYSLLRTSVGWQVQAFLPRHVSANDRIKVIDWFHSYRSTVHKDNPLWLTSFNCTDQAYFLDIMQASSPKDLIIKATDATSRFQQREPYQLSLDYAK